MMITAIDFGSSRIRSIFRNPEHQQRISLFVERSEYALLKNSEQHRRTLEERQIGYAVCEDALAVVGNQASQAGWMSRVPCAQLLPDGMVPSDDPPARQLLHLLVTSMLPRAGAEACACAVALPRFQPESEQFSPSHEFLLRLVSMAGYRPLPLNPAAAALLATGSSMQFSGISIVMGAETTDICIARFGQPVAAVSLTVGGHWIETEIARQFHMYAWDASGACYLDPESVRTWIRDSRVNLRHSMGERERTLCSLYTAVLDRVVRSVNELLHTSSVETQLLNQRFSIVLSGGAVTIPGFASLLTDRLIEHQIADRILAVRLAADPELAVIRGALICAELEAATLSSVSTAA